MEENVRREDQRKEKGVRYIKEGEEEVQQGRRRRKARRNLQEIE